MIYLTRNSRSADGIFGHLNIIAKGWKAFTLEHAYPLPSDPEVFAPKIPVGNYECIRGMHRLEDMTEDFETFEITGVAGHTGLLFHVGNYNSDTEGCILLGTGMGSFEQGQFLLQSHIAFMEFMHYLKGIDAFTLTIMEEYGS